MFLCFGLRVVFDRHFKVEAGAISSGRHGALSVAAARAVLTWRPSAVDIRLWTVRIIQSMYKAQLGQILTKSQRISTAQTHAKHSVQRTDDQTPVVDCQLA